LREGIIRARGIAGPMIGVRCLHKGRFAGGKVYHIPAAAFAILEIKTARTGSWIGLRRIGRIAGPHRSEHGLAAHGRRLTLRLTLLHPWTLHVANALCSGGWELDEPL